ncbi:unnamed protein product [Chondrus crispus]|uniref:Uncharacterized protein n=1 Tax=Chondrus crispus TaxID=2769 RepID=R7Q8D6_CHOCR|nr:unnamed protein product [Chondrus crispus]CDF34048.1 unnamed protein product [Chondrus crispus]|eukprot:XP_005713867.1 unnamed protein product [Chondrus crispus]
MQSKVVWSIEILQSVYEPFRCLAIDDALPSLFVFKTQVSDQDRRRTSYRDASGEGLECCNYFLNASIRAKNLSVLFCLREGSHCNDAVLDDDIIRRETSPGVEELVHTPPLANQGRKVLFFTQCSQGEQTAALHRSLTLK